MPFATLFERGITVTVLPSAALLLAVCEESAAALDFN